MLSFGSNPRCKDSHLPEHHISRPANVHSTLNPTPPVKPTLESAMSAASVLTPPTASPTSPPSPLLCSVSAAASIPTPISYCNGLICKIPGLVVFRARLDAFVNDHEGPVPAQIVWVNQQMITLTKIYPRWEDEVLVNQYASACSLDDQLPGRIPRQLGSRDGILTRSGAADPPRLTLWLRILSTQSITGLTRGRIFVMGGQAKIAA